MRLQAVRRDLCRGCQMNVSTKLAGNYFLDCLERTLDPYRPPVTVDRRNELIGQTLVELVEARRAGRLPPEPQVRRIQPELIELT